MNKRLVLLAILACAAVSAVVLRLNAAEAPAVPGSYRHVTVEIRNAAVLADLADSEELLILGLSGRTSLPEGRGMWFDFGQDAFPGIWMKDMNFPIDILWLNSEYKVVLVEKNVPPDSYPKTFDPKAPARYVLEVPAGFAEKYNVSVGDIAVVHNRP